MQVRFNHKDKKDFKDNRVIVRVWSSKYNVRNKGENVGHVSLYLEREKTYISLWPKECVSNPFDKASSDFHLAFDDDFRSEGREPELTFSLYSLNIKKMKEVFDHLKETTEGWCLFGGCTENFESCVSLAWKILEAGQISKLIPTLKEISGISSEVSYGALFASKGIATSNSEESDNGSKYSSEQAISLYVKSPDALITQLKIAKTTELKRFPITKDIEDANNSPVRKKSDCRII